MIKGVDHPDIPEHLVPFEVFREEIAEIAEILQISLENVKVRLHRARVSLKKS